MIPARTIVHNSLPSLRRVKPSSLDAKSVEVQETDCTSPTFRQGIILIAPMLIRPHGDIVIAMTVGQVHRHVIRP